MKPVRPLSDLRIRKAKPKAKPYRLYDGDGLALLVQPTGSKSWQLRYRLDNRELTATIGKLDAITLADARSRADALRKLAGKGQHLTVAKHTAKAVRKVAAMAAKANTFESIEASWRVRESRRKQWTPDYHEEVKASDARHLSDLFPLPVATIRATTAFPILDRVERTAPAMAEKVTRRLHAIMDYAVEVGAIDINPLPRRPRAKVTRRHYPAVTDVAELGAILRAARASDPAKAITRAHVLLAFTAQRIAEVVGAQWDEFDLANATWSIPRSRMKRKDAARGPHVIPLPPHLLATLREWKKADGDALLVCPAPRDATRSITPEGCEKYYRDALGLQGRHSPHSWRASFKSICSDAGKPGDVIEAQLDHQIGSTTASAYDRAQRLELRRVLLRWYEQVLLAATDGAKVLPLKRKK